MTKYFRFKGLFQKNNWLSPAFVGVDDAGLITYLSKDAPAMGIAFEAVEGYGLPGFKNSHSHAFQYAMAGLAERHPHGTLDDFWTWREAMYHCALSVDPDQAEAIAAQVYAEMLKNGYTHVAEFHYLHHNKEGKHYAHLAEMGERMVRAAAITGIKITLIPVFYQKGNFGVAPFPAQRRFISKSVDDYLKLLAESTKMVNRYSHARMGFSVHSLRAVELEDVKETFKAGPGDLPFHLHVAEQKKEVSDCLSYSKKRPMQWLLENLPVNDRFFLIHSTHLDDRELERLATTGASVVLCPSTEGNLGDGIFRMKEYVKLGGRWCMGSDSQIGLNPLEEFRMIDYRQRLVTHQRNTFEIDGAAYLINEAFNQGSRAVGHAQSDNFAVGQPLDTVVFDAEAPLIANVKLENLAATIVYSSDSSALLGTIVDGTWRVRQRLHYREQEIRRSFSKAMAILNG